MNLIYSACFYPEKDGGYSVIIPDLPGCCTQGNNLEEAMKMAQDAALGWLLTASEENEEFPKATNIKNIKLENENGFVTLLFLDLGLYFQKYGNHKVCKKTIEIPTWLNEKAEKKRIDFSQTMQEALLYKITH